MWDHAPRRLLDDEETAKRRYLDRLAQGFRIDFGNWTMRPSAGVIKHDIGFAEPLIRLFEQAGDGRGIGCVGCECLGAGLVGQRCEFVDIAGRQSDAKAGRRQPARE